MFPRNASNFFHSFGHQSLGSADFFFVFLHQFSLFYYLCFNKIKLSPDPGKQLRQMQLLFFADLL